MSEPNILQIVITAGTGGSAVFPTNTQINAGDAVFWLNKTSHAHQPAYKNPTTGKQILWGTPPDPLPPQQPSSQVTFAAAGTYPYFCSLHPTETGQITVE
jgi:plastocyanin